METTEREDATLKTPDHVMPTGAARKAQRAARWAALLIALLSFALVATAQPAAAAYPHKPYSDGTAQKVSSVRTVLAPTATFNNYDLNPTLCKSTNWISEYPTWTVSNVTSTSAYLYSLKITYKPGRTMQIAGGYLVNGYGTQVGSYYHSAYATTAGYTKTWTFNKTVSFGSAGKLHFISNFNPGVASGEPAICTGNASVYFWLRPI